MAVHFVWAIVVLARRREKELHPLPPVLGARVGHSGSCPTSRAPSAPASANPLTPTTQEPHDDRRPPHLPASPPAPTPRPSVVHAAGDDVALDTRWQPRRAQHAPRPRRPARRRLRRLHAQDTSHASSAMMPFAYESAEVDGWSCTDRMLPPRFTAIEYALHLVTAEPEHRLRAAASQPAEVRHRLQHSRRRVRGHRQRHPQPPPA